MRRISVGIEGGTAELGELLARQALLMEQQGLMFAKALCALLRSVVRRRTA